MPQFHKFKAAKKAKKEAVAAVVPKTRLVDSLMPAGVSPPLFRDIVQPTGGSAGSRPLTSPNLGFWRLTVSAFEPPSPEVSKDTSSVSEEKPSLSSPSLPKANPTLTFMDKDRTFKELFRELEYFMFFHRQLYLTFCYQRKLQTILTEQWNSLCQEVIAIMPLVKASENKELLFDIKEKFVSGMRMMDDLTTVAIAHRPTPEPKMFFYGGRGKKLTQSKPVSE